MRYEAVLSEAEMLAVAVLRGDTAAALALADLVLETYHGRDNRPDLSGVTLESLALTTRIRHSLMAEGVETLRQLLDMNYEDFMFVRNLGLKSLRDVRTILAERGLALRGETPSPDSWSWRGLS